LRQICTYSLGNIYNFFLLLLCLHTEKGSGVYNLSNPNEQTGNPEVPPISASDDGGEAAASNRNKDEPDDDDPFSKRRY